MASAQNAVDSQLLRELSLFEGLDRLRLEKVAALFTLVDIPVDTELLREGGQADYFYVLLEGRVALSVSIPGRAHYETTVSTLSKGQLVGWSALLPDGVWQASAHTLKPCRLLRVTATAVRDLCEADHEIGYRIMKNALAAVGQRLAGSRLQFLDIFGSRDD
ncbi:cyclic nucleotide-binding domain-containing protein [Exilibacterium tricleocarpae]|uniref:Cyclic nucleotide-binding domain-containing protein n=1 Tax=Exilibacterium tricleocarpae TaxID=2591008 RepID=A0A545U9J2_9GAMM|nr:cyclic nucleotide-binding domain-containing protein [Exilibacterium tricleocarpae]TQV86138.1 cyclic nucleotide-binding domain-containing protein [Exilibacterium tricleocarpae]